MMRSLFAGVSGLVSHQTRMDVIGNNIANINTIGFKKSRVTFQEMLSQTLRTATQPGVNRGGVNPMQVGLGVQLGSIDIDHTAGSTEPTGVQTDLSIGGNGFFVLMDGERQFYTRAGAFHLDSAGWFGSPATGMRVAGWNAVNGVLDTNQPLEEIRIPSGETIPSRATTNADLEGNLNAEAGAPIGHVAQTSFDYIDGSNVTHRITLVFEKIGDNEWAWAARDADGEYLEIDGFGVYDPSDPTSTRPTLRFDAQGRLDEAASEIGDVLMAGAVALDAADLPGNVETAMPERPKVVTTVRVVDSLGVWHRVVIELEKTADNTWAWAALDEAGNYLDVDGYGAYDPNDPTSTRPLLRFTEQGQLDPTSQIEAITLHPGGGAAPVVFNPSFERVSQYGAASALDMRSQDGYGSGTLEEVRIDAAGIMTGVFSNGLTQQLAQIALATFSNNGGLLRAGESTFEESRNSGLAQIGGAGTADRGLVTPGTLEMSNVDLSEEFTSMIITQRGFQANSRIITTSDEMLQELVNLKR